MTHRNLKSPKYSSLRWLPAIAGLAALLVALAAGVGYSQQVGPGPDKIEPAVFSAFQNQGRATVLAILTEQADTSFAATERDWNRRGKLVVDALRAVADRTQPAVLGQLAAAGVKADTFWVINAIKFTATDLRVLTDLAARSDIGSIILEKHFPVPPTEPGSGEPGITAVEWGIMRIRAPEVWQQFNVRGEGIVVANIDTGVAFQHSALVRQYRGRNADGTFDHNYNWVDPSRVCGNPSLAPCDNNGHGTHTMGTTVGDDGDPGPNQIGVAPKAKWIAAKGCETISCSTSALLGSGQWVLAPTDLNGQNPRPDLRPHVVNNSWGGGPSDPFYRMTVQNWRNAGMFPSASNGNDGPGCGTAGIPAAYPESFGVGATDINDIIAGFSSRGPANFFRGILKPQVSAPGVNVRSSFPPNGYFNISGTSMAAPHVSGAVALMWSARPSLIGNFNGTATALQSTARPRLSSQCGPEGPPNNVYGWGIIDVFAAIQSVTPIRVAPTSAEVCRPASATGTVTVFGGPGLFEGDVTLSLASVSPPTDTITASFDPNPVPAPPAGGSTSAMTIATTADTPAGTYTLTIQGTDGTATATAEFMLVVLSAAPDAPALVSPANGADGVSATGPFSWQAAAGATSYRLEIFLGDDCQGSPVRSFANITGTQFTIPAAQALEFFQRYSWRVTAVNVCGETLSEQCFNFRTLSCGPQSDFAVNGGFEQGFTGWTISATVPPPTISMVMPRSGARSAELGVIAPNGTPNQFGDSEIFQPFTIPPAATNPTLEFWFWPQSWDTVTFDQQYVRVVQVDPPGPTVELMREANNAQTWTRRQFSLAPFVGRTVRILFGVHNDGAPDPTGMRVDDVSVAWQRCGPPDFAIRVTPPPVNEVCAGNSIDFTVGVESLHGPNFTSLVELSARNLPPNTSATFARNPIGPGETTTLTLQTTRPIIGGPYSFEVVGQALEPPPAEPRSTTVQTFISANPPEAPELISPPDGETNVSLRPTLMWTEPFVPDLIQPTAPTGDSATVGYDPLGTGGITPNVFGARTYHVQVALDPDFNSIVFEADTTATSITLPIDLALVTVYYWRVNATNACGTGPYSAIRSFVTGACFSGYSIVASYPQPAILWLAATTAGGKIYAFGGSNTLGGGIPAIANSYVYDPAANAWSPIASMPGPRLLMNAAEAGGKIYVAGGGTSAAFASATNSLFEYTVATNTWATRRPLALRRVGAAMAAFGGKVYIFGGFVEGTSTPSNNVVEYDPATDTYTPKANMPTSRGRAHASVVGGKIYVIGGQGGAGPTAQRENEAFDPATNTWEIKAPALWRLGFDMGNTALGGKIHLFGRDPVDGTPTGTQVYDTATNTWSPFVPLLRAANNNQAVTVGSSMYIIGGLDGGLGVIHNTVQRFKSCEGSSHFIPFVVDGDGMASDISNERTALILSNAVSGTTTSASVLFYDSAGTLDSRRAFSLVPNEVRTITDVIREVRGASGVQNVKGSMALFGSEPLHALASISNNNGGTNDPARVEGQPLTGTRNGFVPLVQGNAFNHHTHTAFTNSSSRTANVQLLAYPSEGGDTPVGSASITVPPHGLVDFADTVSGLGLPSNHWGQLSWNSTQPISVFARDITSDDSYSGSRAVHATGDGARSQILAYVEDTETYGSDLQINNTGPFTANVTVRFMDVADPTGGTPGSGSSRDIPVRVNSATYLTNVIRWALRDESGIISDKRGFLMMTSPQLVTVEATLLNRESADPAISDATPLVSSAFTPTIIRFEPFGPRIPPLSSRIAIGNPGTATATVQLTPFHANGAPARSTPFVVRVVGGGQYFTEDIAGAMGLPPAILGWLSITSDVPVVVYNQRRSDGTGEVVPVYPR